MEIIELLKIGTQILKSSNIENPQLESELLVSNILNIERHKIYCEKIYISPEEVKKFIEFVEKRIRGFPIPYIIKKVYFYDSEFKIEKGVFIPRPETELLVEKTIEIYNENFKPQKIKILDIGTGCGNIAICLAKSIKNCYVKGIDISKKSLRVAKENAILNKVSNKTEFFYSNLFSNINETFEIIVSNPPYVNKNDYEKLDIEVKKEPKKALYGGSNGLNLIKKIINQGKKYLKKKGFLIIEIGYDHSEKIKKIVPSELKLLTIEKDFSGIKRIALFKKI